MHDLVKKTSLHNAYFLSLYNKNKNVMGRKKIVTNYPFTHLKIAINLYEFGILPNKTLVTLVEIVTFLFVFQNVLASIFSICLLSLHNRNNCRDRETIFVIITLHNDDNRNRK